MKSIGIILRIWLITAVIFALGLFIYLCFDEQSISFVAFPAALVAALVGSIPGFVVLLICLSILRNTGNDLSKKMLLFLFFQFVIAILYGLAGSAVFLGFSFGGADNFFFCLCRHFDGLICMYFLRDHHIYPKAGRLFFTKHIKQYFFSTNAPSFF